MRDHNTDTMTVPPASDALSSEYVPELACILRSHLSSAMLCMACCLLPVLYLEYALQPPINADG